MTDLEYPRAFTDVRLLPNASYRCIQQHTPLNVSFAKPAVRCAHEWRCQQDAKALSACPHVLQYTPLALAPEHTLAGRLRNRLRGQHIALLGDSNNRQLWHVGVARLRGEESMIDPKAWNVMRYRQTDKDDCLELFLSVTSKDYHDPCLLDLEVRISLVWFPIQKIAASHSRTAMELVRAVEERQGFNFTVFVLSVPTMHELGEVRQAG